MATLKEVNQAQAMVLKLHYPHLRIQLQLRTHLPQLRAHHPQHRAHHPQHWVQHPQHRFQLPNQLPQVRDRLDQDQRIQREMKRVSLHKKYVETISSETAEGVTGAILSTPQSAQ